MPSSNVFTPLGIAHCATDNCGAEHDCQCRLSKKIWRDGVDYGVCHFIGDVNAVASDGVIGPCGGGVAQKPRDLQPRRMSCSEGIFSKGKRLARSRAYAGFSRAGCV